MILAQILCELLTTLCHNVTVVEGALGPTGASGAAKKANVLGGVEEFLATLVSRGVSVVADDVRKVAGPLIDHIVAAAHDIGAFTHKPAANAPGGSPQP